MQLNAIQWSYMFGRAQKRNGCWWQSNWGEVKNDGVLWGVIWAAWEQCIERNHCRTTTSQSYRHQQRKVIEMSALLNNALEGGRGDFWNGWEKLTAIINFNSYATNTPVLQNNEKVIQGSHCGDPGSHPVGEIHCSSCYDVAVADSLLVTDLIVCNCSAQLIVQCNRQW